LDFRAETTAARDQAVTHGGGAEAEAGLSLGTVLEGTAGVAAETAVLIAIQLGGVARDHAGHATTRLAGVARGGTTAKESSIEIGGLGHG